MEEEKIKLFIENLEIGISKEVTIPLSIEVGFRAHPNIFIVLIRFHFPPRGIKQSFIQKEFLELIDSKVKSDAFIENVINRILDEGLEEIRRDLTRIIKVKNYYRKVSYRQVVINEPLKGKCKKEDLAEIGCQVFLERFGTQCSALTMLSSEGIKKFILMELAAGVLLRSCILDCFLIFAWEKDTTVISAIAAESFKRGFDNVKLDDIISTKFNKCAEYFNTDNVKMSKADLRTILEEQKDVRHVYEQNDLYSYYSKYDHFSLIPFAFEKTRFEKLNAQLRALHFIKIAICTMLTFMDNEHIEDFYQILGIKIEQLENGESAFVKIKKEDSL